MSDETISFNWQPLGEPWWQTTAKELGASDRQVRFACAKFRGCSNTEAAREAGYTASTEGGVRSTGYRLARSNMIERLLAFAAGEGEGNDGSVDRAEARRILSSLARGSDPSVRIRACELLAKFDDADNQKRADETEKSPKECLAEIAGVSPLLAELLARENGLDFTVDEATQRAADEATREAARIWIRQNAKEAFEFAKYFVAHPDNPSVTSNVVPIRQEI